MWLSGYWESVAIFAGINILMGLRLYIPMSAGLGSLGHAGFMAIGAYTSAYLTRMHVPFGLAIAGGAGLSGMIGLLVGAPALRIRGIYIMILTMGFGEITRVFFLNFQPTGGALGFSGIQPLTRLGWIALSCVIALLFVWRLRRSRLG